MNEELANPPVDRACMTDYMICDNPLRGGLDIFVEERTLLECSEARLDIWRSVEVLGADAFDDDNDHILALGDGLAIAGVSWSEERERQRLVWDDGPIDGRVASCRPNRDYLTGLVDYSEETVLAQLWYPRIVRYQDNRTSGELVAQVNGG